MNRILCVFLPLVIFLAFYSSFLNGCAGNQHTLDLSDLPRPAFIGNRISPVVTLDSSLVQRLRSVSCYTKHEKEGETISKGKHVTLYKDEHDFIEENIRYYTCCDGFKGCGDAGPGGSDQVDSF